MSHAAAAQEGEFSSRTKDPALPLSVFPFPNDTKPDLRLSLRQGAHLHPIQAAAAQHKLEGNKLCQTVFLDTDLPLFKEKTHLFPEKKTTDLFPCKPRRSASPRGAEFSPAGNPLYLSPINSFPLRTAARRTPLFRSQGAVLFCLAHPESSPRVILPSNDDGDEMPLFSFIISQKTGGAMIRAACFFVTLRKYLPKNADCTVQGRDIQITSKWTPVTIK